MPKTVMIVEDNELNMKLFHDLLEAHGYRTIGTRDGFECSISPASAVPI
jgi:two-component system, cell cycle response regulator DivK